MTAFPAKKISPARRVALWGLMAAMALAVNPLELLIPMPLAGVRPGFANIFPMAGLFLWGPAAAVSIGVVRILLGGLINGWGFGFLCSAAGGLLSLAASVLLYRLFRGDVSILWLSCFSALVHNAGQLAVAGFVVGWRAVAWYGPMMVSLGLITGLTVGILAGRIVGLLGPSGQRAGRNEKSHASH